jgi:hypothetical protein
MRGKRGALTTIFSRPKNAPGFRDLFFELAG